MVYAAVAEYRDPLTFKEAMRSTLAEEWRAACQYEIDALAKNCTWTLVDLPAGRRPLDLNGYSSEKLICAIARDW